MTASESLAIGRSLDPVVIIVGGQLIVSGGDIQTVGAGPVVRTDTIERASIVASPAVDEEFLVPFVFDAPLPIVSRDHVMLEVDGRVYLTGGTEVGEPTSAGGGGPVCAAAGHDSAGCAVGAGSGCRERQRDVGQR